MAIKPILERLERGERSWSAELLARLTGLVLLAAIWPTSRWLRALETRPPIHQAGALEFLAGVLVLACLWGGLALAGVGPRLLARQPLPPRPLT